MRNKKWIGYYEVFCAGLLSVLCNVPYLFAYDIVPCKEVNSTSNTTTTTMKTPTTNSGIECWDYTQDPVRKTHLWIVYSYVAQVNYTLTQEELIQHLSHTVVFPTIFVSTAKVQFGVKFCNINVFTKRSFPLN